MNAEKNTIRLTKNQAARKPPPQILEVDRRYWMRGDKNGGAGGGSLNGGGHMCVLGIYLHQVVKLPKRRLLELATPSDVATSYQNGPRRFLNKVADAGACWLLNIPEDPEERADAAAIGDSDAAEAIYAINDNQSLSESTREARIKAHFKQFNVKVVFTH